MTDLTLTRTRIVEGHWEGVLTRSRGTGLPRIAVTWAGQPVPDVSVTEVPEAGHFAVRIPIPQAAVTEGVQTFVVTDPETDETLDSFTLIAGEALAEDIRAEIDLLRAELDMLKRAFRRHCVETAG